MLTSDHPVLSAFAPLAGANAQILILGSMPGVASLEAHQYYAHPRNSFWHIMFSLFGTCPAPSAYEERVELLTEARVALWDVLAQCKRPGSLDSNIDHNSVVCNDFPSFLASHQHIRKIAFNGKVAEQLFRKHVLPSLDVQREIELVSLPSSSPAMASLSREEKAVAWQERLR